MFQYRIEGMTCSACSAHVERDVAKLPFVQSVQVSLLSNTMKVETKDGAEHEQETIQAVEAAGYGASPLADKGTAKAAAPKAEKDTGTKLRNRFWWSLAFMLPLMYVSMQHMIPWPIPAVLNSHGYPMVNALMQSVLATPVLYINRSYFAVGFKRLFTLHPNMDSLIAVGSGAAYAYGLLVLFRMAVGYAEGNMALVHQSAMELYFESAVMILTLITLGKFFEARAKRKTTAAIEKLMELTPDEATVVRDDGEHVVSIDEVRPDDTLLIRPGERIPVDGVLLDGHAAVDQSHITGESMPVDKAQGDELVAGSMNRTTAFHMRATKVGEDTTLSKIVKLVQEAGDSKAPISKLADRVSGIFVPVVMVIALATLVVWLLVGQTFTFALSCAIAVLVISCPCALGLATPVAIMVGTGVGAQHGILFRNGEVLETLHHIGSIVLDKTGTITEGRMTVQAVEPAEGSTREQLLRIAVTMEYGSEHPLAEAVRAYCAQEGLQPGEMSGFEAVAGRGISATVDGWRCLAGNAAWMRENNVSLEGMRTTLEAVEEKGYSVLCFAQGQRLLGVIGVSDTIKPTSAPAVRELKELQITPYLLTGDQRRAAVNIAAQAGIEQVIAEVMPQDKAAKVRELQQAGKPVAMVGDGINDAPALKQADIGIAVGTGTDIAIETADVVLAGNRLTDLPTAVRLSRAVIRNIRQNLFWAFFYNTVGIPVAAGLLYPMFGITLSPMLGAAAMSLSSVCVVANALRLRRFAVAQHQREEEPRAEGTQPATETEKAFESKQQEDTGMEKIIHIEGMSCNHCKMSVEKALGAVAGVRSAVVDLEKKQATVTVENVEDAALQQAVTDAGFEVIEIR